MRVIIVGMLIALLMVLTFRKGYKYALQENKPTAIEVYQGKTTLKYTVINNQIVDSIVVYK